MMERFIELSNLLIDLGELRIALCDADAPAYILIALDQVLRGLLSSMQREIV